MIGLGVVGGLSGLPAAQAQPAELVACARIVEDAERLACYDRAVPRGSAEGQRAVAERTAETERQASARARAEAAAAEERRVQEFGMVGRREAEGLRSLEATVADIFTDRAGLKVLLLENGQVWRQTDGVFRGRLEPGMRVVVRRTGLGGYVLGAPDSPRVLHVRRIR